MEIESDDDDEFSDEDEKPKKKAPGGLKALDFVFCVLGALLEFYEASRLSTIFVSVSVPAPVSVPVSVSSDWS